MAKTLRMGQTYTDQNGDVWNEAVLHVDMTNIDWKREEMTFTVAIYRNEAARVAGYLPLKKGFNISKQEFLDNFNQSNAITTLKAQTETFALTLPDNNGILYGNYFE